MREIEVIVPKSKEEQHKIASILSKLDDVIENNRRINDILDEQTQGVLYRLSHENNERRFDHDCNK